MRRLDSWMTQSVRVMSSGRRILAETTVVLGILECGAGDGLGGLHAKSQLYGCNVFFFKVRAGQVGSWVGLDQDDMVGFMMWRVGF
ncbi:unnamed protein product [Linum trigynum]|uniref:Uncharacterized protein n=1 Tax=Linum trigynum TaxID=586398 RepID=A0AAV2DAB9_9ROSI